MSRNYSVPSSSISKDRKSSNNASEVEDVDQRTDLEAVRSRHVGIGTFTFHCDSARITINTNSRKRT